MELIGTLHQKLVDEEVIGRRFLASVVDGEEGLVTFRPL